MPYRSYSHDLVFQELAAKTVKLSANEESFPVFLALVELARVSIWNILPQKCLRALSFGLSLLRKWDKRDLFIILAYIFHFENFLILNVAVKKLVELFLMPVFFILNYWFPLDQLYFFPACQHLNLMVEKGCVLIQKAENLIGLELFALLNLFLLWLYLKTSPIGKRNYCLTAIRMCVGQGILVQGKWLLSKFY